MQRLMYTATLSALLFAATAFAQNSSSESTAAIEPSGTEGLGAPSATMVVERGPNHRVIGRVVAETMPSGKVVTHTNTYVELGSGMNYWDPTARQWLPSQDLIEAFPGGAVARHGPCKVIFANDLATPAAVDLQTPDGAQLSSHILGLAYVDAVSGASVLICETTNSLGQLVAPNRVIYENAFDSLRAYVQYTYSHGTVEQDVVLLEAPPLPEVYGLKSSSARLVVMTEMLNPPTPQKQICSFKDAAGAVVADENLDFGSLQIGAGTGFMLDAGNGAGGELRITKQWTTLEGRHFLLEQVPVPELFKAIGNLPKNRGASLRTPDAAIRFSASSTGRLPGPRKVQRRDQPMEVASHVPADKGCKIDYQTLISTNNFVFQSDITYYITGPLTLSGITRCEGGSVIKVAPTNNAQITVSGTISTLGQQFRPTIFTARDDDTVGEVIYGSTGNPTTNFYGTMLSLNNAAILNDCRFLFAQRAVASSYQTLGMTNVQFIQCSNAIRATYNGIALNVRNGLFWSNNVVFAGDEDDVVTAEHLTVCQPGTFFSSGSSGWNIYLTNSLLVGLSSWGGSTGGVHTNQVPWLSSPSAAFQSVGAGYAYLAGDSSYRNAGTTNINSGLAGNLKLRTTYPPIPITNAFTGDTTLTPQAQRDTDLPDLGYHYDPIDWAVSSVTLTNTLLLTNGAALGVYGINGISLGKGSKLICRGEAANLNHIVRYGSVQEQPILWGSTSSTMSLMNVGSVNSSWPEVKFRFTDISLLANGYTRRYIVNFNSAYTLTNLVIQDCQICGGALYISPSSALTPPLSCCFTNNLIQRGYIYILQDFGSATDGTVVQARNNLFQGGTVLFDNENSTTTWSAFDNLFDRVSPVSYGLQNGTNGYVTNYNKLYGSLGGDVVLTNTPIYQNSRLGAFYYPTNDGMLSGLMNKGSRSAASAGLYHFTTTPDQFKETNSIVDIGFHYVAINPTSVAPYDGDGDCIADYLEDANGNGTVDTGESPWTWGIQTQPQSTNIVQAQDVTFSVVAGGVGNLTYQWQSNGVNIAGANASSLLLQIVKTNFSANYSVIVSNGAAYAISSNAFLAVTVPLDIVTAPVGATVLQGSNATFTIVVSGNYPAYQWSKNGSPLSNGTRIAGATGSMLTVSNAVSSDAANYSVMVTNLFGSVSPSAVPLTVITNPAVVSGPTNTTAIQSEDVTLSTTMAGVSLGYQWWLTNSFGTNALPGGTNSVYTKLVIQTNDAGTYSVIATNAAEQTNASATLTVLVPPWITQQPMNVGTNQGSNATFTITASGTTNLNYQWYKNGTNVISGATQASLTLSNVQAADAAGYSVLVTNLAGTNFSAWAWLSVNLTSGSTTNGWGSGTNPLTNAPTVTMISPTNTVATNPAVLLYGQPKSIRASAFSKYSYVTNVVFYAGTNVASCTNVLGSGVPGANTKFAMAWTNALPGTNTLKVRAWDYQGTTNDSALVYVIMDKAPAVSTLPSNINLIWEGYNTNVWFTNYVSDDGLPYSQTNLAWNVPSTVTTTNYYTYTSSNIIVATKATITNWGSYALSLTVSDGFASNSTSCNITVRHRPSVSFNTPTNNSICIIGAAPNLNCTALTYDGSVPSVKYYSGTGLAFIDSGTRSLNNTFICAWANATLGTNLISAVATDGSGISATSQVNVVVVPRLAATFLSPINSQLFILSPTNILLTAQITSYVGSTPSSVLFTNQTSASYIGRGTLVSNNVYQCLWAGATSGTNTLTVTAWDYYGNMATNGVTVTINWMPVVTILYPTNGQIFTQITNITLQAQAYDTDNGTNVTVQFYSATNKFYSITNLIGTATNSFGTNQLVWSNLAAGFYPIVAIATDSRNARTISALTVFRVASTNPAPAVAITYPATNAMFAPGSDITITATATNWPATVTNVEFFVNGDSIGHDTNAPYSITKCCWVSGNYTLAIRATDNVGMFSVTNLQITIVPEAPANLGFWDQSVQIPKSITADPGTYLPADPCGGYFDLATAKQVSTFGSSFYLAGHDVTWAGGRGASGTEGDYGAASLYKWDGTNWLHWGDDWSTTIIPFIGDNHNLPVAQG